MISEHREHVQLRVTAAGAQWLEDHAAELLPLAAALYALFPTTAACATCEPNPIGSFVELMYAQFDKCAPLIAIPPEAREALVANFTRFYVEALNNPNTKAELASEGLTYNIQQTASKQGTDNENNQTKS
jgi:hypothetical protein